MRNWDEEAGVLEEMQYIDSVHRNVYSVVWNASCFPRDKKTLVDSSSHPLEALELNSSWLAGDLKNKLSHL